MTEKERDQVKVVARTLLQTLKDEKFVLDWRTKSRAKGEVLKAIEVVLDDGLPEAYDEDLYSAKCASIYRHVFEAYHG
ncbi:hypothetical protein B6V72_18835 [Thioclava sp. F34-6]|nr:hypothetical protein B6V72_18835 [Thioclava sp. F34-6]